MKIFVIGYNKTATTSIYILLKKLNINAVHSNIPVLKIIDKYDAFTDGEHLNFDKYYEKYPDSLFILNTRPIYKWLISRYKHAQLHNLKNFWPISDKITNTWILKRTTHHRNVLNFFADKPKQLLIVNIEKTGYENCIAKFIGKGNITIVVKENVIDDANIIQMKEIIENVSKCLKTLNYDENELLLSNYKCSNNYITFL